MFFPYFELAASLFTLLLAFQIWTRHYENKVARFYGLFALVAFLASILTYSLRIAFTLEIAADINRISGTLWAFVFALYAHFALLFTKKHRFLAKPISYVLLYLPPTILGYLFIFTDRMYLRHEIWNIGIVSTPAPLYSLFTLEAFAFCLLGIVVLLTHAWRSPQKTTDDSSLVLVTDLNDWSPGYGKTFAPHGATGPILRDGESIDPSAAGASSRAVGGQGGNVGSLDGSVQWVAIDQMTPYRASRLWGSGGCFALW